MSTRSNDTRANRLNRYLLLPVFDPVDEPIDLDADTFRQLTDAKNSVIATVGIEEKFDLLMENYVEYEEQLLQLAMRYLAFHNPSIGAFQQERVSVTRRLVNLLSAARLYLDQLHHDLGSLFGKDHEIRGAVTRVRSEQYDARFGYRLMESLRNSVQHRSIAAISVIQHYGTDASDAAKVSDLLERAEKRQMVVRVMPVINRSELDDLELKATVKSEIIALGKEQIDLTPHVRDYMDGLGAVHSAFRKHAQERRSAWEVAIRKAFESAVKTWPEQPSKALTLKAVDGAGKEIDSTYLVPALLEYLEFLETKNRGSQRLLKRYVSSRTDSES